MSLAVWLVKKIHLYVYEDEKGMWSFQGQNFMYVLSYILCTGQKICTIFGHYGQHACQNCKKKNRQKEAIQLNLVRDHKGRCKL